MPLRSIFFEGNVPQEIKTVGYATAAFALPDEGARQFWEVREWAVEGTDLVKSLFNGPGSSEITVDTKLSALLLPSSLGWLADPDKTRCKGLSGMNPPLPGTPAKTEEAAGPKDIAEFETENNRIFDVDWVKKEYYVTGPPRRAVTGPNVGVVSLPTQFARGEPLPRTVSTLKGAEDVAAGDLKARRTWTATPQSYRVNQVRVWFNIFIPDAGDDIVSWPNHPNKTLVRAVAPPTTGPVRGPIRLFSTDQRTFSSKLTAASRVHCQFDLWMGTADFARYTEQGLELTESVLRVGETIEVSGSGAEVERKTATPTLTVIGPPELAEEVWTIPLRIAAADPLVTGAPTVGAEGEITLHPETDGSVTVSFAGNVDHWPCFEMYAQSVSPLGEPATILNVEMDPGTNAFDLLSPRDKWVVGNGNVNRLALGP
ncbi:MAG: hypothetical protein JWM23_1174 [Microbacteriaceae bacterium]|nr:hypothetical protein [Microbacteriaceae bacterium]